MPQGFQTLYLLQYNNYYNRIVKRESNLLSYVPFVVKSGSSDKDSNQNTGIVKGVNFNPGNYVDTIQVVNWSGGIPDYLIVVNDDGTIDTRWFVISANRTRQGQLQLQLHRDLMVDFYDEVLDAPAFIEKATIASNNNPLLFKSEGMDFNQIKTSETPIKDASECPWLVIYCDQKTDISGEFTTAKYQPVKTYTSATYKSSGLQEAVEQGRLIAKDFDFKGLYLSVDWLPYNGFTYPHGLVKMTGGSSYTSYRADFVPTGVGQQSHTFYLWDSIFPGEKFPSYPPRINEDYSTLSQIASWTYNNYWNMFKTQITEGSKYVNQDVYNLIEEIRGGIIQIDSDFYQVNVSYESVSEQTEAFPKSAQFLKDYGKAFNEKFSSSLMNGYTWGYSSTNYLAAIYSVSGYKISLTKVSSSVNYTYNLQASKRMHNIDAPYDMLCIPFSDNYQIRNSRQSTWTNIKCSKQFALDFAKTMLLNHGGSSPVVYDAQILPYCPITYVDFNSSYIDLKTASDQTYSIIESGSDPGCVIWCDRTSFSRVINLSNPIKLPLDPMAIKIENDCDLYRIVSPNFSGAFEFNAMKNGGLSSFQIACTYKPYNPYIKVYPSFGFLYGSSYNDQRGLICTGDFSLPQASDAWETFERQNVNYQKTFDRQIENMEFKNEKENIRDVVGAVTGTISGVTSGASAGVMAGAMTGNPVGMLAGGVIGGVLGGVASGVAGGVDVAMNKAIRKEEVNFARDNFNLQLGNIKALPTTLSKTTAYNVDNKYFPFLEYYTCTNEEKLLFKKNLQYRGMTIGAIGTIREYQLSEQSYIRGRLIRIEELPIEYEIANNIADEFYQGVFI